LLLGGVAPAVQTVSTVKTVNIEVDLPTLDEARRRAIEEIRNEGVTLLLLR
jgi:hypothetical protein